MLFLEYSSRFSLSVLVLALERDRARTGPRSGLEKDTGLGTRARLCLNSEFRGRHKARTRLSFNPERDTNLEKDTRLGPD